MFRPRGHDWTGNLSLLSSTLSHVDHTDDKPFILLGESINTRINILIN